MATHPTSRFRFLDLAGEPIACPAEWTSAVLEIDAPLDDWQSVELSIQGRAVPVRAESRFGRPRVLADWARSGAGNFSLDLKFGDYREREVIEVRPRKISEADFTLMIEELQQRLPASIAIGLQKAGGLSGIQFNPPARSNLAQEVLRLRRAIDGVEGVRIGLVEILSELARSHHSAFRPYELWVNRRAVRRPSGTGLAKALVRGRNLDEAGKLLQVLDRRTQYTVDVYENQLITLYVQQVRNRMHFVTMGARRLGNSSLIDEVESLLRRLDRARRIAGFLDEVSLPSFLPLHLSMVLTRRDPYPAALDGFLEFARSISVQLDEVSLESPLENVPSLYQTWGTLIVLECLIHIAVEAGFKLKSQRLFSRRKGEMLIRLLPEGKPVAELFRDSDGATLRVIPERYIACGGAYQSESFAQQPDIVVEIEKAGTTRLIIFDPKYKLDSENVEGEDQGGRPKKEDIDKMHAYRDAIRDPSGRRPVVHASILYPGPTMRFGDGIAALRAVPSDTDLRANIGAIVTKELSLSSSI